MVLTCLLLSPVSVSPNAHRGLVLTADTQYQHTLYRCGCVYFGLFELFLAWRLLLQLSFIHTLVPVCMNAVCLLCDQQGTDYILFKKVHE